MKAFVLAETEAAARELCAGARTLADEVVLCALGAAPVMGVADKCIHITTPPENVIDDAYVVVNRAFDAEGAQLVLAEQTQRILSLVGRLAAHVKTATITGVMAFDAEKVKSLYFGGTGTRSAKTTKEVALYSVGTGVFADAVASGTEIVEELAFEQPALFLKKVGEEALPKSDVNLAAADVVIACGRGFAAEEDLQLARDFAAKAHAEVGCTRPLTEGVDWFPREAYLGVSGQVIAPKVYVAAGISGQMQHMVGCNQATVVIAINKDKNAPIFNQCDYGIIGDIKTVLPALSDAL